jgi:hypothetical protein
MGHRIYMRAGPYLRRTGLQSGWTIRSCPYKSAHRLPQGHRMIDIVYLIAGTAFFVVAAFYVTACDQL